MYQEIKSRRLALLVAIALTGGSLAGATNAYAAEVTGQNVTINASNPPSNNVTDPYNDPGSAAGAINDPANGDDVSGNTLTLENYDYSVHGGVNPNTIYGGFTRGTGRAKENIVHICSGGIVDAAVGGINCGGGDAVGNRVYLHAGGLVNEAVSGGSVYGASGSAENNHVVIESGRVNDVIYGGCIGIASTGHATGNTVTITGGEIRGHVYGGFTYGNGDVTGNIVNIGDGAHDLATGTSIQKSIYGGSNDGGSGTISGNILNVKASASAQNIHNFDTINFYFTNTLSPKLTLSDTAGTTIKRLRDITVNGFATIGTSTLIENANGITVSEGSSSVSTTGDTAETILSRDTTGKKIDYTRYVFKGARTAKSSSFHETWGGRSVIGNTTTGNEITVTSGTHNVVYGGWTRDDASSQTATADKGNSTYNKVTVDGTETVSEDVYGGMTTVADGKASHNEVTINEGVTLNGHGCVYGGSANSGSSVDNKVYLNGIRIPGTVYGGSTGLGTANGNEVHLNGATVTGSVYGGAANGTGNLLSVKGVNRARWIAGFQKVSFDTAGVAAGQHMLTITDTANRTALDWNALTATGTARGIDLIYHENGIDLSHYTAGSVKSALSADGKSEYDIEAVDEGGTVKRLAYNSYRFKDARTAETVGGETWGGRSRVGNTTTGNVITVGSGTHTNVYGGWTRGAYSQIATADKGNSTHNKVTVNGSAAVSGTVYGGFTNVANGKATNNEVHLNGVTVASVYGGSGGTANENEVHLDGVTVTWTVHGGHTEGGTANENKVHLSGGEVRGDVFGGDGLTANDNVVSLSNGATVTGDVYGGNAATTNNNIVNIDRATVTGTIRGGEDGSTGNTLNVKGVNRARQIAGFQKVSFDTAGAVKNSTLLTVTGNAATKVDWTTLTATGTAEKPLTLLKNDSGIELKGYTGAAKSETTDTAETNVDVRKNSLGRITAITYEGYQFARAETASVIGTDAFGGISKAGNSTHDNAITVNGDYTNVYGGHTSGAGTTKDDKDNSYSNSVTITGGTIGNVYGGYTAAADGTTNHNTVTLAGGTVTGTVSGGNRTAQGNKLVVNAVSSVSRIENFEKYVFNYKESMAANPMLTLTGGAAAMNLSAIEANGTVTETPTTLVHNAAGLTIADYDNKPKSMLNADGTRETNLDVRKTGTLLTDIVRYSSYSFKGTTESTTNNGNTWGGRSSAGNTTAENSVTITGGNHTDIYGGWTTGTGSTAAADALGDSISNKVAVNGSAAVSGTVYGGFTDVANGKATRNEVTVDKAIAGSVVGGKALGEASGNTVTIKANTGAVTGGEGAITNNNTVNLEGASVNGTITGGTQADGMGNTLNVKGQNAAQNIVGFQKVAFKDAASKLKLTDTGTFNLDTLATNFDATANPVTLVESGNALKLAGGKAFKSELNADGTQETDLDVRDGKRIVRYAYTFKGAKAATTVGTDTWGGRSAAGNTTTNNEITLAGGSYTNVYGGWTTGAGSTATDKGDSISNKVTVNGTAAVRGIVYGGYTDVTGGRATGNEVTIEKATVDSVVGGYGTTASGNVINLTDATVSGSVTGGRGTITNDNIIRLRNTKVTGTVTGGSGTITNENRTGFRSVTASSTAASGTGNTLAVYYGTGTTSIGDLGGIQNIHFDLEDAPTDGTAHTLLSLTNAAGEKNLSDIHLAVHRSGATKKLRKGDTFTLVENTTAGGSVSIGDNVTAEGTDGVTRSYTFGIARNADGKLVATVTKAGMNEQAKSLVETRAGASAFLNDGADFLAGAGMSAAQKEAAAAAMTSGGVYGLWAGMGGGSLRHETGSYVDMKGWNLGVGWARENAVKAGTLTFGPFVEYGRGSYDSYLDDGTHGSGKTSYVGVGMMAKLETKANSWIDGALRVGRTKSDYTGLDTGYDTTSTYYAMHVGVGKDFRVREGDTVSAYVRYSYAHTADASAHLSSGETYDFDAVNSHRLRIGTRYTHGETALSQFYAGLAWEYEFGGDARATCDGDSTPSPSLRGGSGLLELGYRFAPKADSRVSYDLSLSGWQGKRQGVTGGISVKWTF